MIAVIRENDTFGGALQWLRKLLDQLHKDKEETRQVKDFEK